MQSLNNMLQKCFYKCIICTRFSENLVHFSAKIDEFSMKNDRFSFVSKIPTKEEHTITIIRLFLHLDHQNSGKSKCIWQKQ